MLLLLCFHSIIIVSAYCVPIWCSSCPSHQCCSSICVLIHSVLIIHLHAFPYCIDFQQTHHMKNGGKPNAGRSFIREMAPVEQTMVHIFFYRNCRKRFKKPYRPYEKEQLDAKLKLVGEYSLHFKRELCFELYL